MRLRTTLALVAAAAAAGAALAHRPIPVAPGPAAAAWPHRARGALHVHTGASGDGHGDVSRVAREARDAGLDFVALADHNTEASVGVDGYRHGVLVLGGLEKSTQGGHAAVLGLTTLPFRLDGDPAAVVRDVADLGGLVVAAHPTSAPPQKPWTASLEGVAGIEVLNFAEPEAWPQGAARTAGLSRYAWDPLGALLRSLRWSGRDLAFWEREAARRPVAAVLGSDAHGGFPTHGMVFRLASQHLLLDLPLSGAVDRDRAVVLRALRRGHGYLALDGLASARGFSFEARSGGERAVMGDSLPLRDQVELRAEVDAPPGTTLILVRDGREIARGSGLRHRTTEAGVYRVEAWLDPRLVPGRNPIPWILSNGIAVFPGDVLARREEEARRLPTLDAPLPESVETVESFDARALPEHWLADRSADAAASLAPENGTLRFDFRLGGGPRTHASACEHRQRNLTPFGAVVLRVRADRRLRFDLQVRTADPGSAGGVRIWRRSVRAETGWRSVAVPFAELTTYDGRGGRPDLDRVRGVYVHLDEAMLPPGGRGTLWIDDFGLGR